MDKTFELGKELYMSAIEFAKKAHEGQFRAFSMAPYFTHPVRVATLVMKYKKSHAIDDLVVAALLHDVVEDTTVSLFDITMKFGHRVSGLVEELTSDEIAVLRQGKTEYLTYKMLNMSSWALVIKLCDRLDNVMDFIYASDKFVEKYTKETRSILKSLREQRHSLSNTHLNIMAKIEEAMEFGQKKVTNDKQEDLGRRAGD